MAFGKNKAPRLQENRLPFWKLMAWKTSDITIAATTLIVNTYLTMFCSDFLGMNTAVVGTILLVSNILDFITDLIAAYIVDNTNTKWGKGRPYELGVIGVTICTTFMFFTPNEWSQGLKIAWVFFMYTFTFGVFNTLRGASTQVYMVRAFKKNRVVIGKLSSFGGLITTIGSMVVSLSFPKLMAQMATSAAGWRPLILIYMIPLTILSVFRFIFVKEDPTVDAGQLTDMVKLADIFKMIKTNNYAWYYTGIIFLFNIITNIGALSYYFKYIVGDVSMSGIISIFGTLLLPTMLVFPLVLKKFSAPQIVAFAGCVAVVGYVINFFAGASIPMLLGAGLLTAFAMLPVSYLSGLMQMDLASYNEYNGLNRMDASTGAIFNGFGTQLGQGVGGFLMGIALSLSGYVTAQSDAVVAQPDSAVFMIRCMYSLVPMALMILLVICAIKLSKLSKQMPEIEKTIAERRIQQNVEE